MGKEAHGALAIAAEAAHLGAEAARVQPQLKVAVCVLAGSAERALLQGQNRFTKGAKHSKSGGKDTKRKHIDINRTQQSTAATGPQEGICSC